MKHDDFIMLDPENQFLPCWNDSQEESEALFQEAIQKIKQWSRDMVDRICNLRQKSAISWVRGSGNLYAHYTYMTIFNLALVRMTVSIQTTRDEIQKLVTDALDELDSKNQLCTEINCICNQQYTNCPLNSE